jgi:hypothetical protein
MDKWDQNKLENVVEQKNAGTKPKSDIVIHSYFNFIFHSLFHFSFFFHFFLIFFSFLSDSFIF